MKRVFTRSVARLFTEGPARWASIEKQLRRVNRVNALRRAVARGRPYGDDRLSQRTARTLGTESFLRPIGRPKKSKPLKTPDGSWAEIG